MSSKKEGVSDKEVQIIKQIIINSKGGTLFGKKVMFYLLDNSKNLTQPVGIGFLPPPVNKTGGEGGRGREAIYSIHDIRSENQCQTPKLDFFESCYSKPIRNGTMFCWLSKKNNPSR